jgi:hypothetical protein
LMTGKSVKRSDPLTGASVDWKFSRNYGCNSAIGCTNLLAFRSAAAGYFDLAGDGGTGNLGGFRSSCTSNLVPADGVLSAPDYTRTCICSYQNQCSLAFVHMPEIETWTFNTHSRNDEPVKRLGINFGAPGDRRVTGGSLWIEIPSVGGTSPKVPVEITGQKVEYFRQHSARIESGALPWVAASGVRGAEHIKITLQNPKDPAPARKYTVRLYFADLAPEKPKHPENAGPARMDVALQDRSVLTRFDVRAAAGGVNRGVVREFKGIEAETYLEIKLEPTDDGDSTTISGVEIVEE